MKRKPYIRKLLRWLTNIGITLLLLLHAILLLKQVYFDLYYIPTNSMANTLKAGDLVLVKRLNPEKKLNIQRGDIVVFQKPNENLTYIKRCCGLPGDTVQIINSTLFINGKQETNTENFIYSCRIKNTINPSQQLDSLNINFLKCEQARNRKDIWIVYATKYELDIIIKDSVHFKAEPINIKAHFSPGVYPRSKNIKGSRDNWGPVVVPFNGMDPISGRYHRDWYKSITHISDSTSMNMNTYFVLGDNRHDSNDSRYWGFLKKHNIKGKVVMLPWPWKH